MGTHIQGRWSRGTDGGKEEKGRKGKSYRGSETAENGQGNSRDGSREPTAQDGDRIHKKTERLSSCGRAKEREKAFIIAELRQRYPLKTLLELSGIARSTYYYHLKQKRKDKYKDEKQEITEIYKANKGRYGYRRICAVMRAKGWEINHKTVLKLMKSLKLCGKQSKSGKYRSYKGEVGKVAENLLHREFKADKPFEKLTTDVTEFKIGNEKVYLSPVLDMYNREIVAYSISTSPNLQQIRDMLDGLFQKLPADARPLFHSDQGWQYQHAVYQKLLAEHNITQSMSRKGNCMDNGIMENFFGRLKVEMFYGEIFESPRGFIEQLEEYIHYYNNERISLNLKGMSPVQFRTHSYSV